MSANNLLISDLMITERTAVHGNIDSKLIGPDIKVAQDMFIFPLLGTALFNKLQTLTSDNSIDDAPNVNYKILIDSYIVDTLIYYTLSLLPTSISFQFWNKGVLRKGGDNSTQASMLELMQLGDKYRNTAEFYATRMKNYLRANASEMFPEYLNPGNSIDTVNPGGRSFTSPIYLGDSEPRCPPWGPYKD